MLYITCKLLYSLKNAYSMQTHWPSSPNNWNRCTQLTMFVNTDRTHNRTNIKIFKMHLGTHHKMLHCSTAGYYHKLHKPPLTLTLSMTISYHFLKYLTEIWRFYNLQYSNILLTISTGVKQPQYEADHSSHSVLG